MRKTRAAWLMAGGVWLSTIGCSSGESKAEPVPLEKFGELFAKAVCDNMARCCFASDFAFDQANCEGRHRVYFQSTLEQFLSPAVRFDEVVTGKCLVSVREEEGCNDDTDRVPYCEGMLVGLLEQGETCNSSTECKSGACSSAGVEQRTCSPLGDVVAARAGESCDGSCEDPSDCFLAQEVQSVKICFRSNGLFCGVDALSGARVCNPLLRVGDACQGTWDCAAGAFCQQVCVAPRPIGANCMFDEECQTGACVDDRCAASAFSEGICANGGPL
jgi:hypothetical protein